MVIAAIHAHTQLARDHQRRLMARTRRRPDIESRGVEVFADQNRFVTALNVDRLERRSQTRPGARSDGSREKPMPIVYPDTLLGESLDAMELLAVVCSEGWCPPSHASCGARAAYG